MNPTVTQLHVNQPLTNFSVMFQQDTNSFVADKVFKTVPVEHKTDTYYIWNRGDFNRNMVKERSAGAESEGAGFNVNNSAPYTAKVYALHKDISDQERGNADSQLDLDFAATQYLTNQMLIDKETRFVNNYFVSGVWSNETTPSALWSAGGSTPIENIRSMKRSVQLTAGGYRPNTLVLGRAAYDVLIDHAEIIPRIQYAVKQQGEAATVTKDVLAQLFEVDQILVMDGIVNQGAEGGAESNAFIAGKSALLVYVPNGQPTLNSVAAGLTFSWTGQFGSTALGTRMLSIPMPWLASTRIESEAAYAQQLVSADLGGFFLNAVA
jgi:hypothetical protein